MKIKYLFFIAIIVFAIIIIRRRTNQAIEFLETNN